MPHIAPVILKRHPGFLGTPERPPLWYLGPETAMGMEPTLALRCTLRTRLEILVYLLARYRY